MVREQQKRIDILIADDDAEYLKLAENILAEDYSVATTDSGDKALRILSEAEPQLILLDLHMPGLSGEETMAQITADERWKKIPVIILTTDSAPETEIKCFTMGAADFIVKPFVPLIMKNRVSRVMELYGLRKDLEGRLEEKSKLLEKVSLNSIMAIANTIDAKDAYTSGHSLRVAKCAKAIAEKLGWSEEEARNIYHIGLLHDIGKIGVPDSILNKPSRLNEEEFALIKKHPVIGGEILKNVRAIKGVADGALYHHERYDGKGYPLGLSGEDIPLCARIIAIADTYDAMTSNRIYRAKLPDPRVVAEFERCSGTQFDPKLAALFVEMLKEGFHIPREKRREEDAEYAKRQNLPDENGVQLNRVLTEYGTGKGNADHLTGVNNRSYGETEIEKRLARGHKGALLVVDLDNFKNINDTYGHLMGDKVLKVLAASLAESAGEQDLVCRLGGDEFVVFLTELVHRDLIKERIHKIMDAFAKSMDAIGCENMAHISVGIALSPADGKEFPMLYANADKALYYVKRSGKNSYSFFRDEQPYASGRKPCWRGIWILGKARLKCRMKNFRISTAICPDA